MWPAAAFLLLAGVGMGLSRRSGVGRRPAAEKKIVTFWQDVPLDQGAGLVSSLGGENLTPLPLINAVACRFPRASGEFFRALTLSPQIMDVEDDTEMHILCWWRRPAELPPQSVPWGVERIGAPDAWRYSAGEGVKVGVIDTGVNANHPDLQEAVKGGLNLVDQSRPPGDDNGHGTHVAGIIAARNNRWGVVGVAPACSIYALKAFDSRGTGSVSLIIAALQWCVENDIRVVNMSFGGQENRALGRAVQVALDAGLVLVAAAGNDGRPNSVDFPARHQGVVAVTALTADDRLANFSSWGPEVDLAAPGARILSTYGDGYKELSGTSMAAPHVTGTVALVLARAPRLSGEHVVQLLKRTAQSLPSLGAEEQGAGLVNAAAAVAAMG